MNAPSTRIDKWLWYARFFKTRTRATEHCEGGGIRLNGTLVNKAHHPVRPGDVLTFPLGRDIRVVRIVALGSRRGPAPEAQALYEDLSPPVPRSDGGAPPSAPAPARDAGSGRPTKAERRAFDRLRDRD
jgi:Ribosome-associated heat shock protein implicated in the recycling of the 50S subunit (S4 paralog)